MKNLLAITVAVGVASHLLTGCGLSTASSGKNDTHPIATPANMAQRTADRTLIIMFEPSLDKQQLAQVVKKYHGKVVHDYEALQGEAVEFPLGTSMENVIHDVKQIAGVRSVERDKINTIN